MRHGRGRNRRTGRSGMSRRRLVRGMSTRTKIGPASSQARSESRREWLLLTRRTPGLENTLVSTSRPRYPQPRPFPVAEHPACRRVESLGSEMRPLRRQRMGMRTPSRPAFCSAREPTPAIAARDRARCVIHIPRRSPAGYLAAGCASS